MAYATQDHWAEDFITASTSGQTAPSPAAFPESPHASRSYWIREFPIPFEDQWIKAPIQSEVDVAIIGSGISGASVAYALSESRPGLKIAMFEARGICTGATGRNGGHIGRPEAYNMIEMSKIFGVEDAVRQRQLMRINREMMIDTVKKLDAVEEVDLSIKGTLVVFKDGNERQKFVDDLAYAKEIGLKTEGHVVDAEWVSKHLTISPSKTQFGGAYLENSGTIYPRKFVSLLLQTALERMNDFSLHPYTPVSKVDFDCDASDHKFTLTTSKGQVKTKIVFHATNGYVSHVLPSMAGKNGVIGCRAHMIGISPNLPRTAVQLEGGFGYADFWHWILQRPNNGPYLYGLATAEKMGDYNDTTTIPDNDPIRMEMLSFLEEVFPHSFKDLTVEKDIVYDWTGVQGFTATGASIVGRPNPERRGEFVSVGHNGEGMGRCFACSVVIHEAILAELDGITTWTPPAWFPMSYRRNI